MDLTIVQQGSFTSTGNNVYIPLESGVDWMTVYNITQAAANQTVAVGVKYYWQSGFAANSQWATLKAEAADAANLEQYTTVGGFNYIDTSLQAPGILHATITAISNAAIPVVTNTGTNGLIPGNIVRLINVAGAQQFGGMDFTVGYNTLSGTTFSLDYAPQITAGTVGSWRLIAFNPIFYPRHRFITSISQAAQAVVITSVTHGYQVGQAVRFNVPAAFGMVEINGLEGNIVAINTTDTVNSFTVDINSSAFTAFAFPTSVEVPFTPAVVVPIGEDTALALANNVNILSDATFNTAFTGMVLTGGEGFPGGADEDNMFWVAGKSFSVNNLYVD